jgi:hypothetical protein
VAELDAASDASGFELRREQLSQRLLQLLQANGWLGIRHLAAGIPVILTNLTWAIYGYGLIFLILGMGISMVFFCDVNG